MARNCRIIDPFTTVPQHRLYLWRQENRGWLLHTVESDEDAIAIESIGCRLMLAEVYERVELPEEQSIPS